MAEGEQRQTPRGGLVEDREVGVEARGQRVGAQQARAEAVEGADRGALGVAGGLPLAELQQACAHPPAQLRGGALGERDREDPPRGDAVLAHRPHEALHEHRSLPAARPRRQQQRTAAARDGLLLLGGESVYFRELDGLRHLPSARTDRSWGTRTRSPRSRTSAGVPPGPPRAPARRRPAPP